MTETSISEPYLLSAYKSPKRSLKSQQKQPQRAVYASHCYNMSSPSSSEGNVTIAAQADGVHVYDLAALHPLISHTLGPSTTFSCPAVSKTSKTGKVFTTYAVLQSSPDVEENAAGKTVWMWKEDLSATLADRASESRKHKSLVTSHVIMTLYATDYLPLNVLLLSPRGAITLTDADLNVKSTLDEGEWDVANAFLFSDAECSFSHGHKAIFVLLESHASRSSVRIRLVAVSQEDTLVDTGACEIPKTKVEAILASSCSSSGFLSFISQDASWHSYQLHLDSKLSITSPSPSLRLSSLAICHQQPLSISTSQPKKDKSKSTTSTLLTPSTSSKYVSLLSLSSSSHVLLAGLTSDGTEICLLVWDLQFSVVLASHIFPTPSSASAGASTPDRKATAPEIYKDDQVEIQLIRATKNQCLMIVGTSIRVIPFTVPERSTIRSVLGSGNAAKGNLTERWVADLGKRVKAVKESKEEKMVKAVKKAVESSPIGNSLKIFEGWEVESGSGGDEDKVLGYTTVKAIISAILLSSANASSTELLRCLMQKQVVRAGMVEQPHALLLILKERGDWETISIAVTNIPDIPPHDLISALQAVVAHHRSSGGENPALMQVDSNIPAVEPFLGQCLAYQHLTNTPAALRTAVRAVFVDVEDTICIFEILDRWIQVSPPSPAGDSEDKSTSIPSLKQILPFLIPFLDSIFLSLLSHKQARKLIQSLTGHIQSEVEVLNELQKARGPLEEFTSRVKVHKQSADSGLIAKKGSNAEDWRRRRAAMREGTGMIGEYRLEELVL